MRIAIVLFLLASAVASFSIAVNWRSKAKYPVWNTGLIKYGIPNVPPEFDRKITYLSKTPGKQYETDDGPTEYLRHHKFGWNDCLHYFDRDWPFHDDEPAWSSTEDEHGDAPWLVGAPPHINDARRDGWLQCAEQIRTTLRSTTNEDFRKSLVISQAPYIASFIALGAICV